MTDENLKALSSGLVVALLAFSGFLFVLPTIQIARAAQALPTITVTSGTPLLGNSPSQTVSITVTNPSSNPYSIVSLSVAAPSGWTVTGCTAGTTFLDATCVFSPSGAVFTASSPAHNLAPGQSVTLSLTLTTPSGTYPFSGTFTTSVQDASSPAYYPGPTFSIQVMDPHTTVSVTVTPGGSNTASTYTAGTAPYTVTATVLGTNNAPEAGLPIVWSVTGYPTSATYSFTPSSGTTDSSGTSSATFQPSNHAGDSGTVVATIGTSTVSGTPTTGPITTQAGFPASVTVSFTSFNSVDGNHYVTTSGTASNGSKGAEVAASPTPFFSFSLTDAFGNSIPLNAPALTSWTVTVQPSASGAFWNAYVTGSSNARAVIKCTSTSSGWTDVAGNTLTPSQPCPTGSGPYGIPYDYFQPGTYGFNSTVVVFISGVYSGSSFGPVSGSSKTVMTSAFATSSPVPTLSSGGASCAPPSCTQLNIQAGSMVNVTASAGTQANVPVTLYLDTATSYETSPGAQDYGANSKLNTVFSGGSKKISLRTGSNGLASAMFTVDTVAKGTGSHAFFVESIRQPTDSNLANVLANSTDSAAAITVPGSPSSFTVKVTFDNGLTQPTASSVPSQGLFVDVAISDAYGNTATNPGPGQIQITLTATGGSLSATNVYIPAGQSDTAGGFGPIVWTMPSTVGQTVTLTASGVLNGQPTTSSSSVTIVSPTPTLKITSVSPTVVVNVNNSTLYISKQTVITFRGTASVSSGYPPSVTITSVTYKLDSGTVHTIPITPPNTFSQILSLSAGLHTVSVNATDSKGNVATTSFQILVDNSPPVVKFTTPNNAVITNGGTVNATITVSQGDLNFTSVMAFGNGTTPLGVTVTGTNNFGSSVTYSVSISGLTTGTWVVSLQAATLAGLSASATPITVKVLLPPNLTFTATNIQQTVVNGQPGVNVTIKNNGLAAKASVWFQLLNSKNQVVQGPIFVTTSFAAGQTESFFFSFSPGLPHGTYTVQVFVTVNGLAYSQTFTLTVTL